MRVDARKPSDFTPVGSIAAAMKAAPPADWQEREDQATSTDERRFRCADCLDMGFVTQVVWKVRVRGWYTQAWYCSCDNGRRQEAGYWFGACYPVEGNRRVKSPRGERELDAYLRAKPDRRPWLPDAVEQLRLAHEEAKKRKRLENQEGRDGYLASKYQAGQPLP